MWLWASLGVIGLVLLIRFLPILMFIKQQARARATNEAVRQRVVQQQRRSFELDNNESETIDAETRRRILNMSLCQLSQAVRKAEIKSETLVRVFAKQALQAHEALNCLTYGNFEEALKEARLADERVRKGEKVVGEFFGVPISIKDSIDVKGMESTLGLASRCLQAAEKDSVIVKLIRESGGIILCKTNVTQLLTSYESSNPVFGRVSNPWDRTRTAGGSSGGEAALVACRGSALGVGTDIGGSVRIPAHFCGVFSLKPSSSRISSIGIQSTCPGQQSVNSSCGLIGRSTEDLIVASAAIFNERHWQLDRNVPPIPFEVSQANDKRKLRIGMYVSDGFLEPSAACMRAVKETAAALRADGHEVIEFDLPPIDKAFEAYLGLMVADGCATQMRMVKDDQVDKVLSALVVNHLATDNARKLGEWISRKMSQDRQAMMMRATRKMTVEEQWHKHVVRDEYGDEWLRTYDEHKLDGVICAAFAFAAPKHGVASRLTPLVSYTALYNLLDFVAGVVPVDRVNEQDIANQRVIGDWIDKLIDADERLAQGMPVGVQVVTPRFREEAALRLMSAIERVMPFKCQPTIGAL